MNTEDDTFKKLKRVPFEMVRAELDAIWLTDIPTEEMLAKNGWTLDEFRIELNRAASRYLIKKV